MGKGIFFTLLAIILTALFVATFVFYVRYSYSRQMDSVEIRINTMNEFIKSLETDLQRALYISSFRALLCISDQISSSGEFIDDADHDFKELLLNGSLGNETPSLMINQTLLNWSKKISVLARNIDLNLSLSVINVSVFQTSPWSISVQSGINLSLSDRKNTALWHRTVMIAATIGIDGLEDPLYLIGSSGKIVRVITPTNVTSWNISALSTHLAAKTFVSNPSAPSFLHRLEGNLAPSPNGIETLVDTNELDIYGEQVLNRSSVDYIYFGTGSTKNYKIHNITDKGNPYFKLDTDHLSFYSVLGYNYTG